MGGRRARYHPLLCCKSNHIFFNKGCKRKESFVFLWFFLVFVDFSCRQDMGKQKVEAFPPRGLPPLFKYIWGFVSQNYIMPPIPGCAAGIIGSFSGLSTMRHSVVRNMPAMDAAFSRATRATLAGSMTPAARDPRRCPCGHCNRSRPRPRGPYRPPRHPRHQRWRQSGATAPRSHGRRC